MTRESDDARADGVYQPDGSEVTADEGILDSADTLSDREADPFDEGWSPPEYPLAVERRGTTVREQREGVSLEQRLAEEVPDPALRPLAAGDGMGDASDTDGELVDGEVGDDRAGRLVAPGDGRQGMLAQDVGIDGAVASAEEAAVHVVSEDRVDAS